MSSRCWYHVTIGRVRISWPSGMTLQLLHRVLFSVPATLQRAPVSLAPRCLVCAQVSIDGRLRLARTSSSRSAKSTRCRTEERRESR